MNKQDLTKKESKSVFNIWSDKNEKNFDFTYWWYNFNANRSTRSN